MAYCSSVDTCCLLIDSIDHHVNLTKVGYQLGTPCIVDIVFNTDSKMYISVTLVSYNSGLIDVRFYIDWKI